MNILEDSIYNKKYVFNINDLLGNVLFTLKLNNINSKEISFDLIEKYACILLERYAKKGIKAEFSFSKEEITDFFKNNSNLYKQSEDNKRKVLILKDQSAIELAKKHHSGMPFKILNPMLDGEVQSKLIEAYNEEIKPKVLEK